MTHDKSVPYMDYVARIGGNEIARTVKLADLRHNSDYTRLEEIDEKARARINKYMAALKLLSESETSYRPYYDRGAQTWRVDFPDEHLREEISCTLRANMPQRGYIFLITTPLLRGENIAPIRTPSMA